jgi:hypothetical protein
LFQKYNTLDFWWLADVEIGANKGIQRSPVNLTGTRKKPAGPPPPLTFRANGAYSILVSGQN